MARFTPLIAAFAALLALVSAAPVQKNAAVRDIWLKFPTIQFPGTGEVIAALPDGTSSAGKFNTGSDSTTGIAGAGVGDDVSGAAAGSAVSDGTGSLDVFAGPGEGSVSGQVKARRTRKPRKARNGRKRRH